MFQNKINLLFKRIHKNSDSRIPKNISFNKKEIKNTFLILLNKIFRIFQFEALWKNLQLSDEFLIFPLVIFIYLKSTLILNKTLILFFLGNHIKKS